MKPCPHDHLHSVTMSGPLPEVSKDNHKSSMATCIKGLANMWSLNAGYTIIIIRPWPIMLFFAPIVLTQVHSGLPIVLLFCHLLCSNYAL